MSSSDVSESGKPDARAIERREFLKRLGIASAAGTGFLMLGRAASAAERGGRAAPWGALPGLVAPSSSRPFYMLSLGDSIMWGQGLAEQEKFRNIVRDWLATSGGLQREVKAFNYSHSGAIIAYGPNPGEDTKRTEPENWGGEIPRPDPTVVRQIGRAVDDLRFMQIDPDEVDLVLLDGGANDVKFAQTLLDPSPNVDGDWVRRSIQRTVAPRMGVVLPEVLQRFPNARVVLTGYYAGVTANTPPATVATMMGLAGFAGGAAVGGPAAGLTGTLAAIGGVVVTVAMFDMIVKKNAAFVDEMDSVFTRLANEVGQGRVTYVSPKFPADRALGTRRPLLWDVPDTDSVEKSRREECHTLYVDGKHSLADSALCDEANTFHPNVAGGRLYADEIIRALTPLLPTWAGLKHMTARADAAASDADTWPVTVTAADRATGAPLNGAVKLSWSNQSIPTNAPASVLMCRTVAVPRRQAQRLTPEEQRDRARRNIEREDSTEKEATTRRVCGGRGLVRVPGYVDAYVAVPSPESAADEQKRLADEQKRAQEAEAQRRQAAEEEARRRAAAEEARRRAAQRARDEDERPRRKPGGRPERP